MQPRNARNIMKSRCLPFLLVVQLLFWGDAALCAESRLIVKKVYTGAAIKLSDGRKISYRGLSVPNKKDKPFYRMCKDANRALVMDRTVAVLTGREKVPESKRIPAFVYTGNVFVNAELIKNGFALVRAESLDAKYKKLFLSLQDEAREKRRGLWAYVDLRGESYYVGSRGNKTFHRPQCFHVERIAFSDKIIFRSTDEALLQGYLQDWRCCPLFAVSAQDED